MACSTWRGFLSLSSILISAFSLGLSACGNQASSAEERTYASAGATENLVGANNLISSSNNFDSDHGVNHLFDGCLDSTPACTTASQTSSSFTLVFDLGELYDLASARLFGDTVGTWVSESWSLSYRSSATETWQSAFSNANASFNDWSDKTLNVKARYLRVTVNGRTGSGRVQARELQVFGQPSLAPFQPDTRGVVEFEAEQFHRSTKSPDGHIWQSQPVTAASGGKAMQAVPDTGAVVDSPYAASSPRLDYDVIFPRTGTYYVWVLGMPKAGAEFSSDSVHVALDGKEIASSDRLSFPSPSFAWSNNTMDGARATIPIATTGSHTLHLFMREDGFIADKILITPDPNFVPGGAAVPAPSASPSPTPSPTPSTASGLLYRATFDNWTIGSQYSLDKARSDFGNVPSVSNTALSQIVSGTNAYSGNALRTTYPAGKIGGCTTLCFNSSLPRSYDELYFSFRIKFDQNFDFVRGGKIPGICGGACNTGGETPSGYDGWSVRMMWGRANGLPGAMYQYVYHPDQPTIYGDDMYYNLGGQRYFTQGRWYRIQYRVKMNTPGAKDGIIQAWVDGQLVLDRRNIRFRDTNSFAIDKFVFSTFFGGGDSSWAPPKTEYVYWDDITIATQPIP